MACEVCLVEERPKGKYLLRTFGASKEQIRKLLSDIPHTLEETPSGVDVYLQRGEDLKRAKGRLGFFVYSEGESLEEVVGKMLKEKNLTLSTAESCTAGLLSARIVNVPGSSEYFVGGVVVYSNEIKVKLLGVREETLRRFGAVSEETCREMLKGLKERFGTDCGVAITGVAGPGGSEKKPEGLTYIGVFVGDKEVVKEEVFNMGRNKNRFLSTQTALDILRRLLTGAEL